MSEIDDIEKRTAHQGTFGGVSGLAILPEADLARLLELARRGEVTNPLGKFVRMIDDAYTEATLKSHEARLDDQRKWLGQLDSRLNNGLSSLNERIAALEAKPAPASPQAAEQTYLVRVPDGETRHECGHRWGWLSTREWCAETDSAGDAIKMFAELRAIHPEARFYKIIAIGDAKMPSLGLRGEGE